MGIIFAVRDGVVVSRTTGIKAIWRGAVSREVIKEE
jgi:hypothetical protein